MDDAYTFGAWIKQRRKRLRLTQHALAKQVGYAEVSLRKIEGDELRPSVEMAERLAAALLIPTTDVARFLRFARDEAVDVESFDFNVAVPVTPHPLPAYALPLAMVAASTRIDWGEAPDVGGFHGREQEAQQLRQWLAVDRCRMVAVLGMGGIGKTALATFVAADVQPQFTAVIWRSLRNAPPLIELLRQWLQALAPQAGYALPQAVDEQLALLMEFLRGQRCLLVLDNFETVLAGEPSGRYLPGYEGYGRLLKLLGEGRHQSCLVLTSREKPPELIPLATERGPVRTLAVQGLPLTDGRSLLEDRGLRGSAEEWAALHTHYSGNPLALQITAEIVGELFAGDIGRFLRQETRVFGGITGLLEQQRARLSALEQDIMFWLAVEREPLSTDELVADLLPPPTVPAVLAALHSLRHRYLVEQTETGFTLQTVVMEYFTDTLIEQVYAEIAAGMPVMLQRYALLKASAMSYVRESQRSLILGPIARRLLRQLDAPSLKDHCSHLLEELRRTPRRAVGYAGGNILNLMVHGEIDLGGLDFSQLALWQSDLRGAAAPDVDLRRADLSQSAFTDALASVFAVAFSPDGQRVAAATMGEEIRIWQVSSGRPLLTWAAHRGWVRSVCFSPDGKTLASAGGDHMVRLWQAEDGIPLVTLSGHTSDVIFVCFSPDGSMLASAGDDRTIRLWNGLTGAPVRLLAGHTGFVKSVCFSPDGSTLASAGEDQTVRLWDCQTGENLMTLAAHSGFVRSVCFSADGAVVATGGYDQAIRLWDSKSGECVQTLAGHTDAVNSLSFSPDGSVLASSSNDRTVRLWASGTGACLRVLAGHTNYVNSTCFSPDGTVLASGSYDQSIRLWDSRTGRCLHLLQGNINPVSSVCFSPDGSMLAVGGYDKVVRQWELKSGRCIGLLQGHTAWVWAVCYSPDGRSLASAGDDRTIRLWNTRSGNCLYVLQGHGNWVNSVCFSPDNHVLASAGFDHEVRLWDGYTGTGIRLLSGHTDSLLGVCFNPAGTVLASSSYDQTVRLWDWRTGACLHLLQGHSGSVTAVCYSPDGALLATAGDDQTVRLWDSQTGDCLRILQGHSAWLGAVCFSPDGSMLASAGGDQTVRLWDRNTGECLRLLEGHSGWIYSLCFNPDGTLLATASGDETVRLWDPATGGCLRTLRADRPYERMNITGARGLLPTQAAALKRLGAVDDTDPERGDG